MNPIKQVRQQCEEEFEKIIAHNPEIWDSKPICSYLKQSQGKLIEAIIKETKKVGGIHYGHPIHSQAIEDVLKLLRGSLK